MDLNKNNEIINMMLEIEYISSIDSEKINNQQYNKFPISELSALGVGFSELFESTHEITKNIEMNGLYRCTLPKGAVKLAQAKDGTGALGSALGPNNKLVGQARWHEQDDIKEVITIPYNPAMLFMAVTLMNIDKKLDSIEETQQEIIKFLEQKEKSNLKGSLDILYEIISNYKYNWNNEKYKTNKYILVQNIKHEASKSIHFHQNQISDKLRKQSILHSDKSVKNKIIKIYSEFKNYQLALYIFSFASFIEVMLLGNYNSEYLDSISAKIENLSLKYRELYTECYNIIEGYANTSVQSHLLKGLAGVSKISGKLISKVPIVGKSEIDEKLKETGNRFEKLEISKNNKNLEDFIGARNSQVQLFVDNINRLNKLYNEEFDFFINKEYIYIKNN